jgi:plasmid stabilization system protein ParE
MPSYELSIEAAADIESTGNDGITTFGFAQALKYQLALESRFELLAQFPRIGLPTYDSYRICDCR